MNIQDIKKRLEEIHSQPLKQFGQNFLINKHLIETIVSEVQKDSQHWIEVGPGLGSLTEHFESQKSNIILIERDKKLANFWQNKDFKVICQDALKVDWSSFDSNQTVFGNLPYQIAFQLILELSIQDKLFSKMIFMMQKEVAERLLSPPDSKSYGIPSVMVQAFWKIESLGVAHENDFYPQPKVKGQILKFQAHHSYSIENPKEFLNFLKTCFSQRRKKMIKSLGEIANLEKAESHLKEMGYDSNVRAEQISVKDFVDLYTKLSS